MMTRPSFSIVTVARSESACLRGAIESVLAQEGCGVVEHIIVDTGSLGVVASLAQEFPHITVVSRKGATMSEALNSGFAAATGEIASCLGESDRYARGALAIVEREIQRHPIVMGACGVCDDQGSVLSRIDNIERSWFDTIKYWVSQSAPIPSAVFFKRAILSELHIESEEVFDESLHFAMDVDLWLRLQEAHTFSFSIPELLAYRPQREMIAKGVDGVAQQAEMSRVFRRHASRRVQPEQNLSFVIPVTGLFRDVEPLLEQISAQTLPSLEVVFVDSTGDRDANKELTEKVRECAVRHRNIAFQCVSLADDSGRTMAAAYDAGVRSARSHIVTCLAPERTLPVNFASEVFRCFSKDEIGILLPSLDKATSSKLFVEKFGTHVFNPAGPFNLPARPQIECVVRKLAWIDSGGFSLHDRFPELEFSMKRLLVMLAHKAWRIVQEPLLSPLSREDGRAEEPFRLYENSVVVDELARELRRNPFSVLRAKTGYGLVLPDDLWQAAQAVMRSMPSDGNATLVDLASDDLREVAENNPTYGPVLFFLAEALMREGKVEDANRVRSRWREVHEGEKSSSLYGGISK